jgi:hypothetical protein
MSSAPTPEGPGSVSGAPHLPEGFTDTFTSRYVDNGELRLHAVTGGDGPPLLQVGRSYDRAVITNAAATATGVVGLVFVAAFAPDEGERLGEVEANSKDSVFNTALVQRQYPTGQDTETATEFAIDPALFCEAFAAGSDVVRSMAQRAGADILEVEGSHVIMVSQPQAVTDLVQKALHAVS